MSLKNLRLQIAMFFPIFKSSRRLIGGVWYKVVKRYTEGGLQGPIEWWTQTPELYEDIDIVKIEVY